MKHKKSMIRVVVLMLSMVTGLLGSSHADVNIKLGDVVKEMSIKGDFRIRHEHIYRPDLHNQPSATSKRIHNRQRFRLRLGMDFKLPYDLAVKTRLASGGGDQTSTNQSFDNNSKQKDLWIDQAYLHWAPISGLQLAVGRTNNPFWLPYTADVVWDGDYNPEGAYQKYEFLAPLRSKVFVNALQAVIDDESAGTEEQALFSQQLGSEFLVFDESKFTVAVGLHEFVNERVRSFGSNKTHPGNRVLIVGSGSSQTHTLLNEFRVLEYSAEYATSLILPLRVQGTYVINKKAFLTPTANTGFQYGAIVGKASQAKSWEVAYFYKRVEADAVVASIADSDFGFDGGTNRRGHVGWITYCPTNFVALTVKHFVTKPIEKVLTGVAADGLLAGNRTQFDVAVKF